jgi:hypothetical protein
VLYCAGSELDWERLLGHLEEDAPLLASLVTLFRWLCPGCAQGFPDWLWKRLRLPPPAPFTEVTEKPHRIRLLDTRNWFGPILSPDEPLEG